MEYFVNIESIEWRVEKIILDDKGRVWRRNELVDFSRAVTVSTPKKPGTKQCEGHHILSMLNAWKKIIYSRIYSKIDGNLEMDIWKKLAQEKQFWG